MRKREEDRSQIQSHVDNNWQIYTRESDMKIHTLSLVVVQKTMLGGQQYQLVSVSQYLMFCVVFKLP